MPGLSHACRAHLLDDGRPRRGGRSLPLAEVESPLVSAPALAAAARAHAFHGIAFDGHLGLGPAASGKVQRVLLELPSSLPDEDSSGPTILPRTTLPSTLEIINA